MSESRTRRVFLHEGIYSMDSIAHIIGFMGLPGGMEWVLILLLGLLLFGRRLPEVGRSMGQSVVEFRKGIKGIEDEIEDSSNEQKSVESGKTAESALPEEEKKKAEPAPSPIDPVDERRVSKSDEVE